MINDPIHKFQIYAAYETALNGDEITKQCLTHAYISRKNIINRV